MTRLTAGRRRAVLLEVLMSARQAAGITQSELASRLGRPQSFVSKYENGERRLDILEFLDVMRAMRADPYEVLRSVEEGRAAPASDRTIRS